MKKKSDESLEVPISAMIDVVFLLLVFFIVTAKEIIPEAHMAINLPSPSQTKTNDPSPTVIEIQVRKNGFYLGNTKHDFESLRGVLVELASHNYDQTVTIKTALNAKHKNFVNVLDICGEAKLKNINIFTLKEAFGK